MGRNEDYLRNAKDAQEWADRARTRAVRERWLKVARGWLRLFKPAAVQDNRRHYGEPSPGAAETPDRSKP